jgi:hypothetical protein
MGMPAETTVLSKSSTLTQVHFERSVTYLFFLLRTGPTDIGSAGSRGKSGKSMTFGSETGLHCLPAYAVTTNLVLARRWLRAFNRPQVAKR